MKNFWKNLPKPFFCLAPMTDVTDCVFRQIIAKYGKPDVFWTEFVSADGLCSSGKEKILIDLKYSNNEHPIVAQIFGFNVENIKKASRICRDLGFDGVDINMGCPDKSIEKQGAGAAMIKNQKHALKIIKAAKEGAYPLPVSVKTRIGYNKNEIDLSNKSGWIQCLLSANLTALTVHLRTRKEMSKVPAHWAYMKRIVEIKNEMKKDTLIIGNGDVLNIKDARKKVRESGCDGVMLGRAIFGNPWLFSLKEKISLKNHKNFLLKIFSIRRQHSSQGFFQEVFPSVRQKLEIMLEHTKLFEKILGEKKNFAIMKKHYKAYVNGFEGAKELRIKLMEVKNGKEVEKIINGFLEQI